MPAVLSGPFGFAYHSPSVSEPLGGNPAPVLPLDQGRVDQWFMMSKDVPGSFRSGDKANGSSWHLLHAKYVDLLDGALRDGEPLFV